jgi:hypothetical protein
MSAIDQPRNSTLVVHAGGIRRSRDDLPGLPCPAATRSWKPVPHHELVDALYDSLGRRDIAVAHGQFCTLGKDDARILGTLDLAMPGLDTDEFRMGLGLRASNDKSCAIQFVASARVFVCDNWAFAGGAGAVFLRKKHTSGLDIGREVPHAVELFAAKAGAFRLDIDRMKDYALPDGAAKEILWDIFAEDVCPVRMLEPVWRLYFDDHEQREKFADRSLWSLNNALTEAVKVLTPSGQHEAGLRIGRRFGRLLAVHRKGTVAPAATLEPPFEVLDPDARNDSEASALAHSDD